jgi:superfamily II DNA/RNA helicase
MPQKDLTAILEKLGIAQLNDMQVAAMEAIPHRREVVLISPTGSGKTLAFLLPVLSFLQPEIIGVQALIVVPTRELAIQIDQVVRSLGSGWKCAAMYGGQSSSKDKAELKNPPTILIGTPGRIADHLRRGHLKSEHLHTLVLDEYDKSMEVGFTTEMTDIVSASNAKS